MSELGSFIRATVEYSQHFVYAADLKPPPFESHFEMCLKPENGEWIPNKTDTYSSNINRWKIIHSRQTLTNIYYYYRETG